MKQMLFELPSEVIKDLKRYALENDTTARQVVMDSLVKSGITTKKAIESE